MAISRTKKEKPEARSVIWAVDPFEADAGPPPGAVRELLDWANRARLRVIPVHVLSLSEKRLEAGALPEISGIESALRRYLHPFPDGHGWEDSRVIVDDHASRAGAVKSLLSFAETAHADCVVVSSHGKTGMGRLVLGSFAETLLRASPWPLYFLPRRTHGRASGRCAIFPTDFSATAAEAFDRFLIRASAQRFDLVLFHLLTLPVAPVDVGMMGMAPGVPESFLDEQEAWASASGKEWVKRAQRAGVRARFVLKSGDTTMLSGQLVLKTAEKEGARIIAMSSHGGHFLNFVAGGVAHEVFRAGLYPVWLYGPSAVGEKSRKAA